MVKNPLANAEGLGSIPGSGRSPGEGNGETLFQKHCFTEKSKHTQKNMLCRKRNSVSHSVKSNSLGSMDCSSPGSPVHGILQVRILEGLAMPSSRGSSQPRDRTQVSYIAARFFTIWAIREALCSVWFHLESKRESQSMGGEVRVAITSSWEGRVPTGKVTKEYSGALRNALHPNLDGGHISGYICKVTGLHS